MLIFPKYNVASLSLRRRSIIVLLTWDKPRLPWGRRSLRESVIPAPTAFREETLSTTRWNPVSVWQLSPKGLTRSWLLTTHITGKLSQVVVSSQSLTTAIVSCQWLDEHCPSVTDTIPTTITLKINPVRTLLMNVENAEVNKLAPVLVRQFLTHFMVLIVHEQQDHFISLSH